MESPSKGRQSRRRWRPLVLAVALIGASLGGGQAEAAGFVYRSDTPPPILNARTFVLTGTKHDWGCEFRYPTVTASPANPAIEQRDLAIDLPNCRKLVQQGVPTSEPDFNLGGQVGKDLGKVASARLPRRPGLAAPAAGNGISSGYVKVWWNDCCSVTTSYDQSNISWTFSGGCVTGYSASGDWGWNTGSRWYLVSNGGTSSMDCSNALADTWSTMRNDWFCWPATVVTYYPLVRAIGRCDGLIDGTGWDQSHTDTGCPFQLYRDQIVRQTG